MYSTSGVWGKELTIIKINRVNNTSYLTVAILWKKWLRKRTPSKPLRR